MGLCRTYLVLLKFYHGRRYSGYASLKCLDVYSPVQVMFALHIM